MWWNPCSICCTARILSSSKSPLCDDFRASRTNCYYWRLGFTCSTAADKLQFLLSGSHCLRAFNRGFFHFFFGCFYLECAEISWYTEKCPFLVFFGTDDGNFIEKYSVTPSWQRTSLWQMIGVRIVLSSTYFKWHTSITVYLQRTSDRSNSHERRCSNRNLDDMHAIWGIYAICVFVWKWGPRPRTSSRCYHGNKSAAPFKKSIFVHPPRAPNCMQNLKGGWKFSFPKMFDSYRDFLITVIFGENDVNILATFPPIFAFRGCSSNFARLVCFSWTVWVRWTIWFNRTCRADLVKWSRKPASSVLVVSVGYTG